MSSSSPSIQSFFPLSSSPTKVLPSNPTSALPTSPTETASKPPSNASQQEWTSDVDYQNVDIGSVTPGPACVTIMGRIANFYNQPSPSKMPQSAKGCIKMVLKDDTGACTVRLWYRDRDFKVRLGQLISIWTPHVSHNATGKLADASAPLFVSIFPEGDRSCHIAIKNDDDKMCKRPLGYVKGEPLAGLMTLKNYIAYGHELEDVKLQVCVKSIGAKKKVPNKNKGVSELVNVNVFDDTAEASLTLWGDALHSVDPWRPSQTVLLISKPQVKIDRRACLSLSTSSLVDIDPDTEDARWLRKFAQKMTKREHVNPTCPDGVFDLATALTQRRRILFTLADVDEWVRETPNDTFTGFLSVLILDMNITTLHMRNMLFCTECCGIPIYSNSSRETCKTCDNVTTLRLNPRIVGTLVDETGSIASGKLLWTPTAWEQLLGRTAEEFASSTPELLRYMEKRFAYLRVTLVFGWTREELSGGRLCVLGVRM